MRALIMGGGIGGPIAAMALQRAGIEAVVHEAHGGPAEFLGLFLGLGINGMRVLRDLDLLEPILRGDAIATPRMAFSSTTGKQLGVLSNGWLDGSVPSITLMRGALQRTLAVEARRRGIPVHYGKRYVGHRDETGAVVACFADGSEAAGDVLLGADGIHSRVRRTMSPDAPAPSYTGLLNLGGIVRNGGQAVALSPTPDTMHMVWGKRAFFGYTVRPDGEAWWFANVGQEREPSREELAAMAPAAWRDRLLALFRDDPPAIAELVGATDEIGVSPIHDLASIPTWHRGRVALLGDAAHAVSPSAGQGASMAMEDAMMLARCLRDIPDTARALARYEQLRRPRAERIVAVGRRRGKYKALESRAAVFMRDLFMPIAFRLFATPKAMSWIYDYEIPWAERVDGAAA